MSRIEVLMRAIQEGREKFQALPEDEKPVAFIVILLSALVTIVAVVGVVALILSVLKAFWWVFLAGVALWYFWPRIVDLLKKNPR